MFINPNASKQIEMTLNQRYRAYLKEGGHLSYKQWREATKEYFNATGADTLTTELNKLALESGVKPNPQTDLTNEYIFGIKKGWFIAGVVTVAVGISVLVYLKYRKK